MLLTHLSQRYTHDFNKFDRAPPREANAAGAPPRAPGVAFDLMALNLADLDALPAQMPPLTRYLAAEGALRAEREAEEAAASLAEALARSERAEAGLAAALT